MKTKRLQLTALLVLLMTLANFNLAGVQTTYYKGSICKANTEYIKPVHHLTAIPYGSYAVLLRWQNPIQDNLPQGNDGKLYFVIFKKGGETVQISGNKDLTRFIIPDLELGEHQFSVRIDCRDSINGFVIGSSESVSVSINLEENSFCPSVKSLATKVNSDNSVTLSWENPLQDQWPKGCKGDLDYIFYDGDIPLDTTFIEDATSWTTPKLTVGAHQLGVQIDYKDLNGKIIGCSDIVKVWVNVKEETSCPSVTSTVSIYPNPVRDMLNIKSDNTIESLELYDALGRLVLSQSGESATESTVNVSSLKDGIYILQLRTASGIAKYKVVVSK